MNRSYLEVCVFITFFVNLTFVLKSQPGKDAEWKIINGTYMPVPPKEHPRLYLRGENIPDLKNRMSDPVLKQVYQALVEMGKKESPQRPLPVTNWNYYAEPKGAQVRAELDALEYLITKDKKIGRRAVLTALDTMRKSSFPDIKRISIAIGRMMITGAIVYDWCYPLLTTDEKKEFITEFLRMAPLLECGYPPDKQGSIGSHTSEFMLMRDMMSAAIAIYDEYPEMYHLTAGRFFREHLPARNWFYPAHTYHQGSYYNKLRFGSDLFPLWIFDRMGAGNVYHPSQQFIGYHYIYIRRADGQFLPSGDFEYDRDEPASLGLVSLLAGSYYKDEYLNNEFLKHPEISPEDKIFEFLWRDTKLGRRDPSDLSLSRYFGFPFGWMIARTGWDEKSVVAEMKVNAYNFSNGHQHLDAGAFQIYFKGPLAIDAGSYSGSSGRWGSTHHRFFHARTIAHNCILVYDPAEKFGIRKDFGNDGGQRIPNDWGEPQNLDYLLSPENGYKTGDILAYGFGPDPVKPDYSYLKGDYTEAYSSKIKEARRSFVFLNLKNDKIPAAMIVFDKVVSSDPSGKKIWLLHSIEKPVVLNNEVTITRTKNNDSGKLINTTLLPAKENSIITPVGGPGKEFWTFGINYTQDRIGKADIANERGEWRVELSPKIPAAEDYFLNVLQVMDNINDQKFNVEKIGTDKVIGIKIHDRIIVFSKSSRVMDQPFTFSFKGKGRYKILLTDLLPGTWQVMKDNKVVIPAIYSRIDDHVLYFEGEEGTYTLFR